MPHPCPHARPSRLQPLLAAALLASACAAGPPAESSAWIGIVEGLGMVPGAMVESIPQFRIDGFRVLDSSHILLHAGGERRYVVTLRAPCPALGSAQRLGYTTSAGSLTRFDKLIVVDRPQQEAACPIDSLRTLDAVRQVR